MEKHSLEFLKRLLDTPGPSGFEAGPARMWREEAAGFAEDVHGDTTGNSYATVNPGGTPKVMLAGHIDEIGLMITHIDDEGFLYFDGIGGWDPQVLVGQRVRVLAKGELVRGVVGKKPIHLIKPDEREKASKITDLWIDIGAANRAEVVERGVRVGDPCVLDTTVMELGPRLLASRSVDNRIGAFVVLEAIRHIAREKKKPRASVTAVATAQEEIGYHGGGAQTSAYTVEPDVALVVDVTFATDSPGAEKKELGDHKLGGGPVLARGSSSHVLVFERLVAVAEKENIPYTITANPKFSSTDADAIYLVRHGIPTGLISVPNRYMHSPNEIIDPEDLENAARLIAAFCRSLESGESWIP
ncbi:MAG TPA: M42 family metallopeptidase [Longimicrobiales bacterium]|nr:M42 family metallopeptidase [Longimicrobiales bacterium]